MKSIYIKLFLILFISGVTPLYSNGQIDKNSNNKVDKGYLSVIKPDGVIINEDIPKFKSRKDKAAYLNKKYLLKISFKTIDELKVDQFDLSEGLVDLLNNNSDVNSKDFLKLLESGNKFNLAFDNPMTIEGKSYKRLTINNNVIGEYFFRANADGLLSSFVYSYAAHVVTKNGIAKIYLIYRDRQQEIPQNNNYYFEKKGDHYYWKSIDSRKDLYTNMIYGNNDLVPSDLMKLQKYWEEILSSIEVDISVYNYIRK